jgi:hypothetical protein
MPVERSYAVRFICEATGLISIKSGIGVYIENIGVI